MTGIRCEGSSDSLTGGSEIDVDVNYVVPVEFPGYTYMWKFHHHASNPIF